jgi:diacylglycerol kinase (ATP)
MNRHCINGDTKALKGFRYNPAMRKGLLLYNPAAGRYPVNRFVRGIIRPLKAAGWQMDIAETLSGTHGKQAAHQAANEGYEAVFAIGGDGTVGQVAAGLMDT